MASDFKLNQITAYLLKTKKADNRKDLHRIYDLSFKAWHETWESTYQRDFNSEKELNSDNFTRQDEVLSLFYDDKCFAVCIFTHLDMNDEIARKDSYFNSWPPEAIKALCCRGPNIITCTQYTICKNFRAGGPKTALGRLPWRMFMTGLIAKYFLVSGKDAMSAITRVNKGIDKVSYRNGGTSLVSGLLYEVGTEKTLVDLVAFYQEEVTLANHLNPYAVLFEELWEKRNGRLIKIAA